MTVIFPWQITRVSTAGEYLALTHIAVCSNQGPCAIKNILFWVQRIQVPVTSDRGFWHGYHTWSAQFCCKTAIVVVVLYYVAVMRDQRCVLCVQHHQPGLDCCDRSKMENSSIFPNSQDPIVDLSICNGPLDCLRKSPVLCQTWVNAKVKQDHHLHYCQIRDLSG